MVFTVVVPVAIEATIKPEVDDLAGISYCRWFLVLFSLSMGVLIFASTFFYKEIYTRIPDMCPIGQIRLQLL